MIHLQIESSSSKYLGRKLLVNVMTIKNMRLKRIVSTLMSVLIVITTVAQNNYKVISNAPLNVRKAASSEASILGTLSSGILVEVISIKNGWAKMRYKDGYGFVQSQYIEQISNKCVETSFESLADTKEHSSSANYLALNANNMALETSDAEFKSQRKTAFYAIAYSASSFEDVKLSGTYGFSWTMLPWIIAPKLYAGIHFSPSNFNYGLNDFNYDEIRLGPAIGYYFTPETFMSMPLDILCDVYFGDNDEIKTAWGLALAPSVYIGRKGGVFLGPQFTIVFSRDSKISCGFRAGLYF